MYEQHLVDMQDLFLILHLAFITSVTLKVSQTPSSCCTAWNHAISIQFHIIQLGSKTPPAALIGHRCNYSVYPVLTLEHDRYSWSGEMGYEWTLHYMMGYVCSCISSSALHSMASKTMRNSGNKSWWVAKLTVVHTTLNQTNSTVAFGTNTQTVYTHTTLSRNYTDQGDKFTKSWVYMNQFLWHWPRWQIHKIMSVYEPILMALTKDKYMEQ